MQEEVILNFYSLAHIYMCLSPQRPIIINSTLRTKHFILKEKSHIYRLATMLSPLVLSLLICRSMLHQKVAGYVFYMHNFFVLFINSKLSFGHLHVCISYRTAVGPPMLVSAPFFFFIIPCMYSSAPNSMSSALRNFIHVSLCFLCCFIMTVL